MTLRRKSKIWRWALMATLCLACTPLASASTGNAATDPRGETGGTPRAPASLVGDAALTVQACDQRKQMMEEEAKRVLGVDSQDRISRLRQQSNQLAILTLKCPWNQNSHLNKDSGRPCESIYVAAMNTMGTAMQHVGDSCKLIAEASRKAASCGQGQAACLKAAGEGYKQAAEKLAAAEKVLKDGREKFNTLRKASRDVASFYSAFLKHMARLAKALDDKASPDHKVIDSWSQQNIGQPARDFLATSHLPLDPARLESEAGKIDQELKRGEGPRYTNRSSDTTWQLPREQLAAAWTSNETNLYAQQESERIHTTRTQVAAEGDRITAVSRSLASLPPANQTPSEPRNPVKQPPASGDPVDIGPTRSRVASRGDTSTTGASRAPGGSEELPAPGSSPGGGFSIPSFAPMGSSEAANTGPMPQAQRLPVTSAPAAKAGDFSFNASAAITPRSMEKDGQFSGDTDGKDHKAGLSLERQMGATPTARGFNGVQERETTVTVKMEAPPGKTGSSPQPMRAPASAVAEASTTTLPPSSLASARSSPGPNAPLPAAAKAELERLADREVARIEQTRGRPLGPGLRQLLKNKLFGDLESKMRQSREASASEKATGSTPAIKSVFQSLEAKEDLNSPEFQLAGVETDAAVQRIVSGISTEEMPAIPEDIGASIFLRVTGAYRRAIKAGVLVH